MLEWWLFTSHSRRLAQHWAGATATNTGDWANHWHTNKLGKCHNVSNGQLGILETVLDHKLWFPKTDEMKGMVPRNAYRRFQESIEVKTALRTTVDWMHSNEGF